MVISERQEIKISCPYCGEQYITLIDTSIEQQQYTEDCQICCSPIVFNISSNPENTFDINLSREND